MSKHVLSLFPSSVSFSIIKNPVEKINIKNYDFVQTAAEDKSFVSQDFRVLENFPLLKNEIIANFKDFCSGYLTLDNDFVISTSWLTRLDPNFQSSFHNHKNCFYSGVYYFDSYCDSSGKLEFLNPLIDLSSYHLLPNEFHTGSSLSWTICPQPNLLVFFPSYLKHRITRHESPSIRHSLAFNLVPTGQYGARDSFYDTSWN